MPEKNTFFIWLHRSLGKDQISKIIASWSGQLQRRTNRFSPVQLWLGWLFFCLVAGGISVAIFITSLTGGLAIHFQVPASIRIPRSVHFQPRELPDSLAAGGLPGKKARLKAHLGY
ncbi:MAG TPA: hypothetical protein VNE41_03680 [Chitinophagaceae bacterium]|nr:hypothetical protein [Chitinophagaceae bacterium]